MNDISRFALVSRPTLVRYGVLAWVCALSMITYIDRVCIKQVGDAMRSDLGLTPQQFGWVFSAFGLAYALFEVPSGWLGDRMGPRKVLARIVIWWSLFTALTGAVRPFAWDSGLGFVFDGFLLLLIIRFLFGMGEAGAYPNIARALRSWFPYERRGFAQGLLWSFGRWGGAVAPLLIGVFAAWFGWRGAFAAFGVLGVVWVTGFVWWFRDTPAEHPSVNDAERALIQGAGRESVKPPPLSWGALLSSPTLWFLSTMYFCSNCGWCFFITWDVEYHKRVLGLTGVPLQLASGAPLFFGGVACFLGGFLTDWGVRRLGRRWGRTLQGSAAYLLGGVFFFAALGVHGMTNNPWLSVTFLCLASFLKDFAMAVSWSTCLDIGHRYSGTVSGFMNMVGNMGTFVSPPIVAALAGGGRWELALAYSGGMFLVAAVCWLFVNPRRVIVYAPDDHDRLRAEGALA